MLEPDVRQMLEVGESCGLNDLEEAYDHYMSHYDMFFLIEDYTNQYVAFVKKLKESGLLLKDMSLKRCTIKEALEGLERADTRSSSGKSS